MKVSKKQVEAALRKYMEQTGAVAVFICNIAEADVPDKDDPKKIISALVSGSMTLGPPHLVREAIKAAQTRMAQQLIVVEAEIKELEAAAAKAPQNVVKLQ
jgi:hypothetical protein